MSRIDLAVRHCLVSAALGAALAGAAPTASAADAAAPAAAKPPAKPAPKAAAKATDATPREGSLGTGTSSGPALTRDQLRQCMTEDGRLKKEAADAIEAQRALERDRADIDRQGADIEAQKATIDKSDQAAVDAYNERLQARGRLIEAYRTQVPKFNQRIEALNASKAAYTKECTDRKYFEDDYEAIKAGK